MPRQKTKTLLYRQAAGPLPCHGRAFTVKRPSRTCPYRGDLRGVQVYTAQAVRGREVGCRLWVGRHLPLEGPRRPLGRVSWCCKPQCLGRRLARFVGPPRGLLPFSLPRYDKETMLENSKRRFRPEKCSVDGDLAALVAESRQQNVDKFAWREKCSVGACLAGFEEKVYASN